MIKPEEVFQIGRLGKPHGIKGELSFLFTDDVFDRVDADYVVVETDGILVPFFIEEYRFRNDQSALLKLEGIDTIERARELTNCNVFFPRCLADNGDDQLSWAQIVGFRLLDADHNNKVIGEIRAVDDSTQNVLFDVTTSEGRSLLVPAAEEFIRDVDAQRREIHVSLPEGLLTL